METALRLANQFISGTLVAIDFKKMFMQFWREIRDDQHLAAKRHPDLVEERNKLEQKRLRGEISEDIFLAVYQQLSQQLYEGCKILPFTKEARLLDRLFAAVELYSPIESRDEIHTDEKVLLEKVQQIVRES
ncbi:MAG: hypothetical protein ABI947_27105 [Chloroflexota bacterium]